MSSLSITGLTAPSELREKSLLPEATIFTNSTGEIAKYYFRNNPWKLSDANNHQKIFRFCIICGDERFNDEKWNAILSILGPPTICNKQGCYTDLAFVPGFVPKKHYLIQTELDRNRIKDSKERECFEEVGNVTSMIRFDKVYKSEEEIPCYSETIKQLEKFPVEIRISEIDSVYFEYQSKHRIEVGHTLADTSDPFLKVLADYRKKSVEILKSLERSSKI